MTIPTPADLFANSRTIARPGETEIARAYREAVERKGSPVRRDPVMEEVDRILVMAFGPPDDVTTDEAPYWARLERESSRHVCSFGDRCATFRREQEEAR